MNKLKEKITQHQITAFLILTYLVTWLLILLFLVTGYKQLIGIFVFIGIFGPALANIIISRIIEPVPSANTRKERLITFLIAWIIATAIYTLNVKTTSRIESPVTIIFYGIIGLLPAIVVASAFSRFPGVRKSVASIIKPKGHIGWYLFALLIFPFIKLVSIPISNQLGLGFISEPYRAFGISRMLGLAAVSFLYGLVFTGGLNEETGWTGFALPRLQVRHSPLIASIVLWFFWVLWHIPMQIADLWYPDVESLIRGVIGMFFARFIFTWLYNKTKGGILTAVLFHASANASFSFLPTSYIQMIFEVILAVFLVFIARMWEKLPDDNPAMYRSTVKNT